MQNSTMHFPSTKPCSCWFGNLSCVPTLISLHKTHSPRQKNSSCGCYLAARPETRSSQTSLCLVEGRKTSLVAPKLHPVKSNMKWHSYHPKAFVHEGHLKENTWPSQWLQQENKDNYIKKITIKERATHERNKEWRKEEPQRQQGVSIQTNPGTQLHTAQCSYFEHWKTKKHLA